MPKVLRSKRQTYRLAHNVFVDSINLVEESAASTVNCDSEAAIGLTHFNLEAPGTSKSGVFNNPNLDERRSRQCYY